MLFSRSQPLDLNNGHEFRVRYGATDNTVRAHGEVWTYETAFLFKCVAVYNFEVEDDHTYFVADADTVQGTDPLWMHNVCMGDKFVARSGEKAKNFGEIPVANQTFRMTRNAPRNPTVANNFVLDLKRRVRDGDADVRQQLAAAGIDPVAFAALPRSIRPSHFAPLGITLMAYRDPFPGGTSFAAWSLPQTPMLPPGFPPLITDHPARWAYIVRIWNEWNTLTPAQQAAHVGKPLATLYTPVWP